MLAHVPSFGRNPRGSPDFLAYPVPKACMHVLGTGVPRCLGVAPSASSPKAAHALGCSLTPGLRILFGRVTCMARPASVPGLCTLGFPLLRGACVWVWVVLGFRCWLRPATPGWGLGWVCFGTGCGFALPFPAGVCGVCDWVWASARFPPFFLGVLGRAWLCARSACTLPFPARVCGVGVCAWAPASAAPRHSWARCRGVCVFVCAPSPVPCTSWPGLRCGVVCWGLGCSRAPPPLTGVLGRVCVCVRAPLVPRPSWLGCAVWACVLDSGFGCAPPLLVRALGCVCVCACAPLATRHSWWTGVCVCGFGFRLLVSFCFVFFCGGGVSWRVVSWLCGVRRWLSRSWVLCSPSPLPLSFRLRLRVFLLSVPAPARCLSACSGCPLYRWATAPGRVSPVLAGWSSGVSSGGPIFGAVWLGGLAASCGWAVSWL